jgi:c-di-GMP-binding flagellar brake protein YcgR
MAGGQEIRADDRDRDRQFIEGATGRVCARVRSARDLDVRPGRGVVGPLSLIAVRFESISTGDQDKIVRFIFSIQRQNREGPRKTV